MNACWFGPNSTVPASQRVVLLSTPWADAVRSKAAKVKSARAADRTAIATHPVGDFMIRLLRKKAAKTPCRQEPRFQIPAAPRRRRGKQSEEPFLGVLVTWRPNS